MEGRPPRFTPSADLSLSYCGAKVFTSQPNLSAKPIQRNQVYSLGTDCVLAIRLQKLTNGIMADSSQSLREGRMTQDAHFHILRTSKGGYCLEEE
jgi:hypothetical protein